MLPLSTSIRPTPCTHTPTTYCRSQLLLSSQQPAATAPACSCSCPTVCSARPAGACLTSADARKHRTVPMLFCHTHPIVRQTPPSAPRRRRRRRRVDSLIKGATADPPTRSRPLLATRISSTHPASRLTARTTQESKAGCRNPLG